MKKMASNVQLLLLLVNLLITSSSGKSNGVCISQGGRFPPFSSEGKPPRKVTKGSKDLTLCRVFRKSTCCNVVQTHQALLSIRRLASLGEANQECLQLWELLECSICDPRVGVQPGPPLICTSLCDKIFDACSSAYFSMDAKTQVLSPCGLSDFVCGRASEWVSNGTELCQHAGFSVEPSKDRHQGEEVPLCYGGKASLDSIADSWKVSQSGVPQNAENLGIFEDFNQWVKEIPFNERVSWAVGGMVLTAGLLFVSKRKSRIQRQRQAAIIRTARRMSQNHQSLISEGKDRFQTHKQAARETIMAEHKQKLMEPRSMVMAIVAGAAIGGPLVVMMGLSLIASFTILLISSPLLIIFSPLLMFVGFLLLACMAGFAVALIMAIAGISVFFSIFRSVRSRGKHSDTTGGGVGFFDWNGIKETMVT